jgi:serine/threonine protein kinase/tetratricopeptide (TPR) repeat protein
MARSSPPEDFLCEAALRLAPEQRATFLSQACGADLPLRRRLEARLQALPQSVTGSGETTLTMEMPGFPASLAPEEKAGDEIGPYKLIQRIGEGGMGSVWMADQTEPIRRKVALKVVKAGLDSNQVLTRFEAERQALALMDHPNIAKVLDAGAARSGRPYFVMELVNGLPLITFCDEERLSIRERLELFVPICQAVQHAHQKGVIHRDLKPSNVLVASYEGRAVPKVIDFGIAKATLQRLTEGTAFTQPGAIVGTLEYMSPEQADLNQLDIDTRCDVYSLGVLLYELLTGSTPLTREAVRQAPFDEILRRIREEEPPRPSTRLSQTRDGLPAISSRRKLAPVQLRNHLRGDLDWIVMKALEKDRARRYETANGLAMDLQRHLRNEPVVARPPTSVYRFQKFVRRHKLAASAAAAVTASLLAGLGVSLWLLAMEKASRHRADVQAEKSRDVAGFLEKMLNGIDPATAKGRDVTVLREILDKAAQEVSQDLKRQPEVTAQLEETIAHVYFLLGEYDKALAIQREALALLTKSLGPQHPDVASALNLLASTLYTKGDLKEAEDFARRALEMRRKLLGNDSPKVAESLNNLSLMLLDEEKPDKSEEAERLQREALALSRKLFGNDHPTVATSLNNLANMLIGQGKLEEAEKMQREELELTRKRVGPDHPDLAISLNNLANLLCDENKLPEAEILASEALALRQKILSDPHPDLAVSLSTLARILGEEKKLPEDESLLRQAVAMRRKLPSADPLDLAGAIEDLAFVLGRQGRTNELEQLAKEALDLREKKAPDDWQTFHARINLGSVLLDQKRFTEAEPLLVVGFEGMMKQQKEIPAEQRGILSASAQRLAQLYEAMGKPEKAASYRKEIESLQAGVSEKLPSAAPQQLK